MPEFLLLLSLASSCYMTGLIWFVQRVHYAQFPGVGLEGWTDYHARHTRATGTVVAPIMLVEIASAMALLVIRPDGMPAWTAWTGAALVAVVWASTFFLQVPAHLKLGVGFDAGQCWKLLVTNWIRTVAWTARAAVTGDATWLVLSRTSLV